MKVTAFEAQKFTELIGARALSIVQESTKGSVVEGLKVKITSHFSERIMDRLLFEDLKSISFMFHDFFKNHLAELIYFLNVPNPPLRAEIKYKNYILGFTANELRNGITFRTVIKNRSFMGKERVFIISL